MFLGRAHWRHGLRVPLEEHVLVMAPPRTFKTAFLADVILRYPGPVIATTTKADVHALTAAVRGRRGPVHVFNPQFIGGVPSTFRWSPVDGCEDPATAIRRADAFAFAVSREGVEDGTFWSAKASDYLRGYFHAAALAGYDMPAVAAWVSGADPHVPERILTAAGAHQWALTLAELRSEAHKTTATVRMVMSRALSFMADPALAASVLPGPGEGFDIGSFLRGSGTVYLIAESIGEDAPVAPLFAAMATEIHYTAALTGQASPSGRLDPPLLMGLDEVTQICPVPLPAWLSDSGGKGIQVVAVVHGEAQLAGRWDDHGRQVVLDTSSVKVFLPGITDTGTLRDGQHPVRAGVLEDPRPGPRQPSRRRDAGHDPPAARPGSPWSSGAVSPRSSPGCRAPGTTPPTAVPAATAAWHLISAGSRSADPALRPNCWPEQDAFPEAPPLGPGPPATTSPSPGAGHDARPLHRGPGPARRLPRAHHRAWTPAKPPTTASCAGSSPSWPAWSPRSAGPWPRTPPRWPGSTPSTARSPSSHGSPATRGEDGGDGYQPHPAPPWWQLAAGERRAPVAELRDWVEHVYRPGYGHLAAARRVLARARPVPVRARHRQPAVVRAVPPARAHHRPAVGAGRVPGPHPARPRRPAGNRNRRLRPRHRRHLPRSTPMTNHVLRQALDCAGRGWPVFPCQPGKKTPATGARLPRRHHRPGPGHTRGSPVTPN